MVVEERIIVANRIIYNRQIEDEDMKQNVYLTALESRSDTYHGLYTRLVAFVERMKKKKEEEYDYLSNNDIYHQVIDINKDQLKILFDSARLSNIERDVLYKRFYQCKSLKEVGKEENLTVPNIVYIEQRGIRKLRGTCLRKGWIYDELWDFFNLTL